MSSSAPNLEGLQVFIVGGAVRDGLLGLPTQDRDWVVVGSTPSDMVARGFVPVGKDFPVFINAATGEEYALARTERKTAMGYHGFSFYAASDVTLEQDLARRDLTINAMARPANALATQAPSCDPFGGQQDLVNKLFRHVSDAFVEDPLRILRVARFAARFNDFSVHADTAQLMRKMVVAGEVDTLVPERVWQETARGLSEQHPSRFVTVLGQCGALGRLLEQSELDENLIAQVAKQLDVAALQEASLPVRATVYSQLMAPNQLVSLLAKLRWPIEVQDLALLYRAVGFEVTSVLQQIEQGQFEPATLAALFQRLDVTRRPHRAEELLQVLKITLADLSPIKEATYQAFARLQNAYCNVDAGAIARTVVGGNGEHIKLIVIQARIGAVEDAIAVIATNYLEQSGNAPGNER